MSGTRWASRLGLLVALAIGLAQTVGPSIASPLAIDEQVSYYLACGTAPPNVFARCLEQSATPPVYFWLARVSIDVGNLLAGGLLREWWLRFPAQCAYIAAIVLAYHLAERWIGPGSGGLAALLLACHGQIIDQAATQARPYALGLMLNLLAGGLILRLRQPDWRFGHLATLLAASVALLWTHYVFAILFPTLFLLAPIAPRRRETPASEPLGRPLSVAAIGAAMVGAGITAFFLAPGLIGLWERREYLNWYSVPPPWDRPLEMLEYVPAPRWGHWYWLVPALLLGSLAARFLRTRASASQSNASGSEDLTVPHPFGGSVPEPQVPGRTLAFLAIWFLLPLYALWVAGQFASPALAQGRYVLMQAGPAALLLAAGLWYSFGRWPAWALVIVMLYGNGTAGRTWERLRQPDRHDHFWLDAAKTLSQSTRPGDLVLVQSGLVENRLMPAFFGNPGYQEYTTSRLSDFYWPNPVERLTLPLPWMEGDWQKAYALRIDQATAAGGRVWIVISADSDIGQSTERGVIAWLESRGFRLRIISPDRVARILVAERPSAGK